VLVGVVVDAETGKLVSDAQLWTPGVLTRVMTDSSGHFRMEVPNVAQSIRVLRIGYDPYSTVVTPHPDSGSAVVFALRPTRVVLCRVTLAIAIMVIGPDGRAVPVSPRVERYPGVVVTARDALTGRAPAGVVAVTVRDGAFRDSVVAQADSGDRVVMNAALDRPGRYDVTVRSEGYREWTASAPTRAVPGCGGEFTPAVFHAWLIPH
jgi:hypothetical protein